LAAQLPLLFSLRPLRLCVKTLSFLGFCPSIDTVTVVISTIPIDHHDVQLFARVHARISIVSEGTPHTPREVRSSYDRLRPLERLQVEKRGWTLDVLQVVQSLGKTEFTLADVYAHANALARLHPNNAHIRDKIRQQLQVLRDLGLLDFLGAGSYRSR
jgi:hypothetical protein